MKTLITKTCANCGRTFITRDRKKIYCELKCEEYAKDGLKVIPGRSSDVDPKFDGKVCLWCGEIFTKTRSESASYFQKKKCCCKQCAQKFRQEAHKK